jgi:hypothetical protein
MSLRINLGTIRFAVCMAAFDLASLGRSFSCYVAVRLDNGVQKRKPEVNFTFLVVCTHLIDLLSPAVLVLFLDY